MKTGRNGVCFQPFLKPSYLCLLPSSPSSKVILGVLSHIPPPPQSIAGCRAVALLWEGKLSFFFLRYNSYFGAQTSAGKENVSFLIISASFPWFLGVQILPLMATGGSEAPLCTPLPLLCRIQLTFGSTGSSSAEICS